MDDTFQTVGVFMKNVLFCLLIAASFTIAPLATAADLSYNYVDFGLQSYDTDGAADNFDGIGLRGSYLVNPNFFIAAEIAPTEGNNIDVTVLGIGGGYRQAINATTDWYAQIDMLQFDTDFGDDDGLRLTGGVRSMMTSELELRGAISYVDVAEEDLMLTVGADYRFMPQLSGFAEFRSADVFGGYFIGARYRF